MSYAICVILFTFLPLSLLFSLPPCMMVREGEILHPLPSPALPCHHLLFSPVALYLPPLYSLYSLLIPFPPTYPYMPLSPPIYILCLPYFCSLCVPFVSCCCTQCTSMCVVTLFCVVHIVCLLGFVMCVLSSRARSVDLHVVPDRNSMLGAG